MACLDSSPSARASPSPIAWTDKDAAWITPVVAFASESTRRACRSCSNIPVRKAPSWLVLARPGTSWHVLALYRLFKEVDQPLAALMVILVLVQVPIGFVDGAIQLAVLVLLLGADFLSVFNQPQREALAMAGHAVPQTKRPDDEHCRDFRLSVMPCGS